MTLAEYQRAVVRVSLALAPAASDLEMLGNAQGFLSYRHMVRTRLLGMAKVAFKQHCALVGDAAFEACFARYLAEAPPNSPLIRDVIADFAPFARRDVACLQVLLARGTARFDAAPAFAAELLSFEENKWRLAYASTEVLRVGQAGLRELDFEGRPVWNPLLVVLPLTHAVHTPTVEARGAAREQDDDAPAAVVGALLMYRPPGVDEVRWYMAEDFFLALLYRSREQRDETLAELVQRVAAARGTALDQALLESLATSLTVAVERGVLLGVY